MVQPIGSDLLRALPPITLGLRGWALVALAIAATGCQRSLSAPSRPQPLPQDPAVQVFFNQAEHGEYEGPEGQGPRDGDDLEALLVEAIAQAQQSVEVAVQELRLATLAQSLAERHRAGVRVRIILENQYHQTVSEMMTPGRSGRSPSERDRARAQSLYHYVDEDLDGQLSSDEIARRDAVALLRAAQVPMLDDRADGSKGSGLMHHKFVVVDGQRVLTGSANFTPSGIHQEPTEPESRGNVNHLLRLESPALAQVFLEEFNILWGDGPGGQPDSIFGVKKPMRSPQTFPLGEGTVTVQFSPTSQRQPWEQSSNGLIAQTLAKARQNIDLALFVFSEQKIADALALAQQRSVAVRGLIDPSFAFRYYSEGLDLLGVTLTQQCQAEKNNRPWARPLDTVGLPKLPPGDSLHHKFAVLDRQAVITGSHNWSKAANDQNDETLLIIDNATVAAQFEREFERLYRDAVLGVPVWVQRKIAAENRACR